MSVFTKNDQWKKMKLEQLIQLVSGQHINAVDYNTKGIGIPYLTGPADFPNGKIVITKYTEKPKAICQKGDILITVKGSGVGKTIISDGEYCISRQLMAIRTEDKLRDIIYYNLKMKEKLYNSDSAGLIPGISRADILQTLISVPTNEELCKEIGEILNLWEEAIVLKEKLINQKRRQKKGLMQKLLTGEVRLPGYVDKWINVKLEKVLSFSKKEPILNPKDYYLLTVKLYLKGIEGTGKKPNITSKGRPYYLREPNELLIGRQNFHNGGIGIVPENLKGHIASNAISSLTVITGSLKFYFYYISNVNFYKRIEHLIGGTGQKEISETAMKKLNLFIPSSEKEQSAIADVLEKSDLEIKLLEEELDQLKIQKKGLMQNLLTGKF